MHPFFDLFKRFQRDERGVFGVFFAVIAIVLIAMSGAVVDYASMQTARSRAQTALDSAALALQAKMSTKSADQLKADAQALLIERLADPRIAATVISATPNLTTGTLNLQAQLVVPTIFVQLVGVRTITTHLQSEATRGSTNLEISVALDTTGSMNTPSSKIQALRDATNHLITLMIKSQQTPTYTRMALVPYSYGVNAGAYADQVRDPLKGPTKITGAAWATAVKPAISSIVQTKNAVVKVNTSANHNLITGSSVYISGLKNDNNINPYNGGIFTITSVTSKSFTLNGTKATATVTTNSTGGTATMCLIAGCEIQVASTAHGLANGDPAYITNVKGTAINNASINSLWTVDSVAANTFGLSGTNGPTSSAYITNTAAAVQCAAYGCLIYNFTNTQGATKTFTGGTCVTERTMTTPTDVRYTDDGAGPPAYTGAPIPRPVGILYPSTATNCVSQSVLPLTSDTTKLSALATNLSAAGSTAGHIGLAWAWYMVSPNWGYIWNAPTGTPVTYAGAAYRTANLIKAVILMTDGQFNTQYCNGVISKDSQNIDGAQNMINCNAPNGGSISQAQSLCTAIKASGAPDHNTILYTVGFDIGSNSAADVSARSFLSGCATDTSKFYQANTGSDLDNAFTDIARNLSNLRLSR